jgi:hypothetical protein
MINTTAPTATAAQTARRVAATVALLTALLCTAFALPAKASTLPESKATGVGHSAPAVNADTNALRTNTPGSGTGSPRTRHQVASRPTDSSGALVFAGICLAAIVATAGGVLAYTARNRRTPDSDPTR